MDQSLPSLWQLRVFECVARHENLSRASAELLRSQPAVTLSINKLEQVLGTALFERARTGTYPTEAGVALLVRAQHILTSVAQALIEVCNTPEHATPAIASGITRTQVRCLVALSEAQSLREAAELVGISESSLQRVARQLERNLGHQLYKNTASGLVPTDFGRELAQRMALIAAQIEAAGEHIRRYDHPKDRSITIGVLLLDPAILLTSAIKELTDTYQDVRIVVASGGYELLLKKLNSGTIDFMIGILKRPDYARSVQELPLYRDKYCVVARRGHPLLDTAMVTVEDLRHFDWVLPQRGSPRRVAFEHIFSGGAAPAASIETYSLSMIREAMIESEMLTVLSLTEMLCEQRIGLLRQVAFDVPGSGQTIGVTMRRDWQPNALQTAFITALQRTSAVLRQEHGFELLAPPPDMLLLENP